jgi:3-oxoacyl-[acyl-carrier-protein] synthase-3
MGIKILGLGAFSPETDVTNDDLAQIMDTNDEWITERTGIKRRQYALGRGAAADVTVSGSAAADSAASGAGADSVAANDASTYSPTWKMAECAAREALEGAYISASDLGLIIASTITADFFTPSVACLVQGAIGATCPAFDIGAACSGFVYAIDTAERFLRTDTAIKYVLVISAEMLSRYVDFEERSSAILFGDGAAAAVITRSDGIYSAFLGADGTGGKHLFGKLPLPANPFTQMPEKTGMEDFPGKDAVIIQNGREVYRFATRIMPAACEEAAKRAGLALSDIDFFIPHQANIRIIETAAKTMKIPMERFIINIADHGNTSSASIPIALCEAVRDGRIKRGDKICAVGFGAGLTYGAAIIEY